jgi:transcriptional regulator with XRE-family HTH domain
MEDQKGMIDLSAGLCRCARAALDWKQSDLAERSGVVTKTIADFERGARVPFKSTRQKLIQAFMAGGLLFMESEKATFVGLPKAEGEPKP